MSSSGVIVVGSIAVDVAAFAPRLPAPGETVLGDRFSMAPGGKGANQAIASGRFGAPTSMVGCVGSDHFATLALDGLAEQGVDTRFVEAVAGSTGVAHIRVGADGQNDIVIMPLANDRLEPTYARDAVDALRSSARVLLLQLEVREEVTVASAREAAEAGLLVVLDPAPARTLTDDVWQHVDLVTPNETEALALTGVRVDDVPSARAAASWFLDRGVQDVVLTLGSRGAVRVSSRACVAYEPPAVRAVDTTAAGDAFTGVLGAALASGLDIDRACRLGVAAGAVTVTRPGASSALPAREEVLALVDLPD